MLLSANDQIVTAEDKKDKIYMIRKLKEEFENIWWLVGMIQI